MAEQKVVVRVDGLTKSFKIPLEASSGIKQKIINTIKGVKGYRTFTPLRDISFEVHEGDFFGIVGRNGSGKSTLLKTIAGIYTPTKGSVGVDGTLVPFIELGVGFNPELTGRENVYLNGALLGFSHAEVEAMYDDIVDFAEIGDFMEEKLKNYSSGMQVRLAFSIAIKAQGDILVLDEVLAVGDAAFQQKCFDYFEELRRSKKTVVLVTHDMSAVERFCNKALILEAGNVRSIGTPNSIADIYREENISHRASGTQKAARDGADDSKKVLDMIVIDGNESVMVEFSHSVSMQDADMYVGITIFRDGYNVGEINSMESVMSNRGIGYSIDKSLFNPGAYEISAALFLRENREIVAITNGRKGFMVRGMDQTRGSALKLGAAWWALSSHDKKEA